LDAARSQGFAIQQDIVSAAAASDRVHVRVLTEDERVPYVSGRTLGVQARLQHQRFLVSDEPGPKDG
jgi:hypothetical protein